MFLNISELVSSIQGEGKFTGYPTTFVRLHGCNLNCGYCDTKYAMKKDSKKKMGIQSITQSIFRMGNPHICITGGEPLLQESIYVLIYELVDKGYEVTIETNGAVEIPETLYSRSFSYCMDIKCPSSGCSSKNKYGNLDKLKSNDEVKFVIADEEDYVFAKSVIRQYPTKAHFLFSPMMGEDEDIAKNLAQWVMEDKIPNARFGIQLHKLVGFY